MVVAEKHYQSSVFDILEEIRKNWKKYTVTTDKKYKMYF